MQNKKGFTLVELIVVIAILAILGTIAFISLQGYSAESRDSKRISDLGQIRTGLQIEQAKEGVFMTPDNGINIGSGSVNYLIQGYAGTGVLNGIRISDNAKDPLDDNYYTYTTNLNKRKFQLMALLENDNLVKGVLPKTYANYENRYPYIIGDSLGVLMEPITNIPLQENNAEGVDLSDNNDYSAIFRREEGAQTLSGGVIEQKIIEESNNDTSIISLPNYNSGTNYNKDDSFVFDDTIWYVSSHPNVAYTKPSLTNDFPNNLGISDRILVFNSEEDLVKNNNSFIIKTHNVGATEVWYDQNFDDINPSGMWYEFDNIEKINNWPKSWAGGLYVWGNNTDFSTIGVVGEPSNLSSWPNQEMLCGDGYIIPSGESETGYWLKIVELITGESSSFVMSNVEDFQSYLRIPYSGYMRPSDGQLINQSFMSHVWSSSSSNSTEGYFVVFDFSSIFTSFNNERTYSNSVRCIRK